MSAQRVVAPDAAKAAQAAGDRVAALLREAVEERGVATLAVSGGSTPKLMFDHMVGLGLDWSKIHLFWVDEREVPPDHDQSNFGMTWKHLIQPAGIADGHTHRIYAELGAPAASERYSDELREFFSLKDGALPVFDIVQCGVGPDAHTASLFPGEPLVHDRTGISAGVHVAKMNTNRITLLPGVLLKARTLLALVSGADKAEALEKVWKKTVPLVDAPAQLLLAGKHPSLWYVDEAAVATL